MFERYQKFSGTKRTKAVSSTSTGGRRWPQQ
jgi:hypothetical protein